MRKNPNEAGDLWLSEGEYGIDPRDGHWYAKPPGDVGLGCLRAHEVTEHEDGTITVSPSILITGQDGSGRIQWHG